MRFLLDRLERSRVPTADEVFPSITKDLKDMKKLCLFDEDGAKEIYNLFSGTYIALYAAKKFCVTRRLPFSSFPIFMEDACCLKLFHQIGYQIVKLDISDCHGKEYYKKYCKKPSTSISDLIFGELDQVVGVLSYFDHAHIPLQLINKVCEEIFDDCKNNYHYSWMLTLEAVHALGSRGYLHEQCCFGYPQGVVTLEKAQLLGSHDSNDTLSAKVALLAMARLLNQDNRGKEEDKRLKMLRPHIECLGLKIESALSLGEHKAEGQGMRIMMLKWKVLLSNSQALVQMKQCQWEETLDFIERLLRDIWETVKSLKKRNAFVFFKHEWFGKQGNLELHEVFDPNKGIEDQAEMIVDSCFWAGSQLSENDFDEFISSTPSLTANDIESFKLFFIQENQEKSLGCSKLLERDANRLFNAPKHLIENNQQLTKEHMRDLRKRGFFLPASQHKKIYFAEKICFCLHYYSRQILYTLYDMDKKQQDTCRHFMELCKAIAVKVRERTKTPILHEYISLANAQIPCLLKNVEDPPNARLERLLSARELCIDCLKKHPEYAYEKGVKKVVFGHQAKLNVFKYLVKANTKLQRYHVGAIPLEDARNECEETLCLLRKEESKNLSVTPNIYGFVGKFYASIGDYESAFACFEEGITTCVRDLKTKAWLVFNYCRATVKLHEELQHSPADEERDARLTRVKKLCESAQRTCTHPHLIELLNVVVSKLDTIINRNA